MNSSPFVLWFEEVGIEDVPRVGGKNASLGELIRALVPQGVAVPGGFAITAAAYWHFVHSAKLVDRIGEILSGLDPGDVNDLRRRGQAARQAMLAAPLTEELEREILAAYDRLSAEVGDPVDVAVRSSATAEDLPDASFAGQQETYLNVRGHAALLDACRRCFASLFTDRAISYRIDQGFEWSRIALSVGVQRMVRSDLAASGVMFSIDTETGFRDAVLINASWGLGENVVQGAVNPDEFHVFKPTLKQGLRPILAKKLGSKEFKLVYDVGGGKLVKNVPVPAADRERFSIGDDEILTLARWACLIEDHYSAKSGRYTPMDMEWAQDGHTGELFIVQARPETVQAQKSHELLEVHHLHERGRVLATGRSVGDRIATGRARVVPGVEHMHELRPREILVTDKTDPDWEPIMRRAAAIVTNRGGRTCHAAIVSRELGLPGIVGTENATHQIADGQPITVSCAEGETGYVYEGALAFDVERINLKDLQRPKTQIMMNLANPEEAFRLSFLPNDGVGLARIEFIISNTIRVHPMALLDYKQIEDPEIRAEIDSVTRGEDGVRFFVDRLAEGVATIAAAFYPKDVIVRLSDFKSNEYANLIGGSLYEPSEENPMLGFRGASRYTHPRYRDGFALECHAIRKVRMEMGLVNVKLMIPFCRTPEEGLRVQEEMAKHGLRRGSDGLEIYVMCEIPTNVIRAGDFAELFDGFSIGSNDLTQLVLGVDRDSEILAPLFDERDPAVLEMVAMAIRAAHEHGRKIGICGQAPSDYPEFAEFLVREGIDSISLNPDSIARTTLGILEQERALGR